VEHYGGAFPLWLAPVQAVIIPITDRTVDSCQETATSMRAAGLRVEVDLRNEKLGYKIREAQMQKVPLMLVVGDREAAEGTLSVRSREAGDLGTATPDALIERLAANVDQRRLDVNLDGIVSDPRDRPKEKAAQRS